MISLCLCLKSLQIASSKGKKGKSILFVWNTIAPLSVTIPLIMQTPNAVLFYYYSIYYNQKCLEALYRVPGADYIPGNIGKEKRPFNRKKPRPGSQEGPFCWGLFMSPREPCVTIRAAFPGWCSPVLAAVCTFFYSDFRHGWENHVFVLLTTVTFFLFFCSVVTRNVPDKKCKWHEDLSCSHLETRALVHMQEVICRQSWHFSLEWWCCGLLQIAAECIDESIDWLKIAKKTPVNVKRGCSCLRHRLHLLVWSAFV